MVDLPLTELPIRSPLSVHSVSVAGQQRQRLAELGIRPGISIAIERATSGGGLVVAVEGSRIAIDRATARQISAQEIR